MDWRYWIELPLIVGLLYRFAVDIMAGGMWADGLESAGHERDIDPKKIQTHGTRLRLKPSFWHPDFDYRAYFVYAGMMLFWAMLFGKTFRHTIAHPGPVFGALGVPGIIMEGVAWANTGLLFVLAGVYAADGVAAWSE